MCPAQIERPRSLVGSPDADAVSARLERIAAAGIALEGLATLDVLSLVLANARYLCGFLVREPAAIEVIRSREALHRPLGRDRLHEWFEAALGERTDEASVGVALRRMKYRAYLEITAKDVALGLPVAETCADLSRVAEVAVDLAVRYARGLVSERYGEALDRDGRPIEFVVMGMGKLGGRELNYSSDIDLIHFYATDDGTAGPLTVHQHFARVCEAITRLIGAVTDEGFVFRVDLDLRPEGRGGPSCNALASAEAYYESWGRTWERVAWLRARPIAGDLDLGRRVLEALRPWIYRRSIDFGTLDAIAGMRDAILRKRQAGPSAQRVDVKLDRGGIRAVEFCANALQLLYGGREPHLRDPSTLGALRRLQAAGRIEARDALSLTDAYVFLRRVEHRLQMEDERQTQVLPQGAALEAIARRLGYAGPEAASRLLVALEGHRTRVAALFDALFAPEGREQGDLLGTVLPEAQALVSPECTASERVAVFAQLGFRDPAQAAHLLSVAGPRSPLSVRAEPDLAPLGGQWLSEILRSSNPERTLTHFTDFFAGRGMRPAYAHALSSQSHVRRLLGNVFAQSDFLSRLILRLPSALEILFEPRFEATATEEIDRALSELPPSASTEEVATRLAIAKQRATLRVGIGDLSTVYTPAVVEERLTALAEATLGAAVNHVVEGLRARGLTVPPFALLGLGKLGGREMSYGSDLDLLLLFDGRGLTEPRASEAREVCTRLCQRVISLLSLPTPAGSAYNVDTRLRPGGVQGLLVTSWETFVRHHETHAGAWERMALVRARPLLGDQDFLAVVGPGLERLTYERPLPIDLRQEMLRLRLRMEVEIARETRDRLNLKTGRGGLVDVEFITQAAQLTAGAVLTSARSPRTEDALLALARTDALPDALELRDHHRFLRRLEHRLRIVHGKADAQLRPETPELDALALALGYARGPLAAGARAAGENLRLDYCRVTDDIRRRFLDYFQPASTEAGDKNGNDG